jgi:hypothetical protein
MKANLFILYASLVSLAHAQPFPGTPGLDELVATAIRERKANAPYFAEGPSITVIPDTTHRLTAVPSLGQAEVATMRQLPAHPVPYSTKAAPSRALASIDLDAPDLGALPPSKALPLITPTSFDPFRLKVEFIWDKPHGQWMNQMLKDIEAAKKTGDMETYTTLTARYTAWAEKYLRNDSPPQLDGKPGY